MAIQLLGERIAIIADPVENKTASGIIVPEGSSGEEILRYGTVAVVGVGRRSEAGNLVPIDVQKGQRVFFHKHAGQPLTVQGTDYVFLSPGEIIGIDDGQPSTLHLLDKEPVVEE